MATTETGRVGGQSQRVAVVRPPVITAMTGIRALAATWVIFYHFNQTVLQLLLPGTQAVAPLLASGYLGVDVFFILSGFIISYNYAERLAVFDRRRYRDFIVARFARVYPIHLLALLLTLGLVVAAAVNGRSWDPNRDFTVLGFIGNTLMLQGIPGVPLWNIPSWSISCEVAAYLLFPFFAGLLMRTTSRVSAALAAALIIAAAGVLLATFSAPYLMAHWWIRIAAEFTVGCLLWRWWQAAPRAHRRWDLVAVAAAVAALAVIGAGAEPYLTLPLLALFVVATAGATGFVQSFLGSRLMQWCGRVSYSLYLVHIPVYFSLLVLHSPRWFVGSPLPVRLGLVTVYAVIVVAAAAVSYYVIEEPARRWITRHRTGMRPHDDDQAGADPAATLTSVADQRRAV